MFTLNLVYLDVIAIVLWTLHAGGAVPGELSDNKCKEYARLAPPSDKCPIGLFTRFAVDKEFPHMVALTHRKNGEVKWLCTGTLISEEFVLAPAHCLSSRLNITIETVRLGITNLSSSDHLQEIKVKEVIPHPAYQWPEVYNDIGLVKLEKKVDFNDYVRPVCLHTQTEIEDKQMVASGWGTTEIFGSLNDKLQKIPLHVVDHEKCNETYSSSHFRLKNGISSETMLCAASNTTNLLLRSGSSLHLSHKKYTCMYDLIGTASFGLVTGKGPDVYTRISPYISWIEEKVWK